MTAILKRELKEYFYTPIGYVFVGFFIFLTSWIFSYTNIFSASGDLSSLFGNLTIVFMFALLGIHAQRQSGKRVGHQIDPQDLHRAQRRADGRQADDSQKQRHDLPQIAAEQIDHRFLDVHVQMASFAHRIHDRRKPIVGQDHV